MYHDGKKTTGNGNYHEEEAGRCTKRRFKDSTLRGSKEKRAEDRRSHEWSEKSLSVENEERSERASELTMYHHLS